MDSGWFQAVVGSRLCHSPVSHCTACKAFTSAPFWPLLRSSEKCGRPFKWEEYGRFRVAASTKKTSRLAAKKGGPVTEFQSLAGVHTGEQAGVVEAEEDALVVAAIMVVVEVMTGEVVVQMVEALVDHQNKQ